MTTVVVCDGDAVMRKTVSTLCEEAGLEVVAETDTGIDAVELARRFRIDAVVIDLSLRDGSGEGRLVDFSQMLNPPSVVVFTAYASDPDRLMRMGAAAVIEKPDVARLAEALARLAPPATADVAPAGSGSPQRGSDGPANTTPADGAEPDRRRPGRPVSESPPMWRSPSGIGIARALTASLQQTVSGDSLLAVVVDDLDDLEALAGPLLMADCRLLPGRLLRQTLRVQDFVHELPEGGFVGVLRGGHDDAAESAWKRLLALAEDADAPGRIRGAIARVGPDGATAALEQVRRTLASDDALVA